MDLVDHLLHDAGEAARTEAKMLHQRIVRIDQQLLFVADRNVAAGRTLSSTTYHDNTLRHLPVFNSIRQDVHAQVTSHPGWQPYHHDCLWALLKASFILLVIPPRSLHPELQESSKRTLTQCIYVDIIVSWLKLV